MILNVAKESTSLLSSYSTFRKCQFVLSILFLTLELKANFKNIK